MFITIDHDPSVAPGYVKGGYSIVVVDVLRATTTITIALAHGASAVYPFSEIDDAVSFARGVKALLVGERAAYKIEGFDYTNSPVELSEAEIEGRNIAITTSTGTRLIAQAMGAPQVLIGSTVNAKAVAEYIAQAGGDWAIIGAGTRGEFRAEDKVGCALIAQEVKALTGSQLSDEARDIIDVYTTNIEQHITGSPSAIKLVEIGNSKDIDFVLATVNSYSNVPVATPTPQGGIVCL